MRLLCERGGRQCQSPILGDGVQEHGKSAFQFLTKYGQFPKVMVLNKRENIMMLQWIWHLRAFRSEKSSPLQFDLGICLKSKLVIVVILETKWKFVSNLKKFSPGSPWVLCTQKWNVQVCRRPWNIMPLCLDLQYTKTHTGTITHFWWVTSDDWEGIFFQRGHVSVYTFLVL